MRNKFIVGILIGSALSSVCAEDHVVVHHADDGQITGEIVGASIDAINIITDNENRKLSTRDLIRLTFGKHKAAPLPRSFILLANDDRIVAAPESIDEEFLVARWKSFPNWPALRVPLDNVRSVALALPRSRTKRWRATTRFLNQNREDDELVLTNGDRILGELISLDQAGFKFDTAAGETSIARNDVRSLGFNAELISIPSATGLRTSIDLLDGSRITVKNLQRTPSGDFNCETVFGATLRLPTTAIAVMRFLGGRAVYLSDLPVADYQFQPFLSRKWPYQKNRNVTGGWLILRDREYAKGLGLHSKCELSFDLDKTYREFRSVVGIDDHTNGDGSVQFRIQLDGETVWSSGSVTGINQPVNTPSINVTGKKRLTLRVEFDKRGDILDHANWCDAILIRSK